MTAPLPGSIQSLEPRLAALEAKIDRLLALCLPAPPSEDEKIFKDPPAKYWAGNAYAGSRMSECSAEYLTALAKYKRACVWANKKENDPAKAKYAERDEATAVLALTWADYQRKTGKKDDALTKSGGEDFEPGDNTEIPF